MYENCMIIVLVNPGNFNYKKLQVGRKAKTGPIYLKLQFFGYFG